MKIKKILALMSAISMLACMTACGDDKDSSSKKEIQTETVAAEGSADSGSSSADESTDESSEAVNAETSSADDDSAFTEDDVNDLISGYDSENAQDTVISLLEKGFSAAFGENMKVEYNNSTQTYELAVWQNGFAAALDTDAGVSALSSMSSNLTSSLSTMETQIQMLDSNAKLKFSFLSDKDQSTPLLVIENGQITYDITKN